MRNTTPLLAAAALIIPTAALADGKTAVTPALFDTPVYSQNFDSLSNGSGTSTTLPAGFQIVELGSGSAADGRYAAGTGSSNAGNTYSFGAAGSTERALGSLGSGSVAEIRYGGLFTNQLGGTITSLAFAFRAEQWRAGNSPDDGLTFEFSSDATQLDNGSWMEVSALNFAPLVLTGNTALNGNATFRPISGIVDALNIGAGQNFGFRFRDFNSTGSDHGLAIDDLSITASLAPVAGAVPEPSTWALMLLGFGAIGSAMRRRRSVAGAPLTA